MADNTAAGRPPGDEEPENQPEEPIVHDKRRIDPETGKVRQPEQPGQGGAEAEASGPQGADEGFEGPDVETSLTDADLDFLSGQSSAEQLAAERLTDLQRLTAEYANYRKRTEANREVERERLTGDIVMSILPVLDDLDRAEKHGDLEGDTPFAAIARKLRTTLERFGLQRVGETGEPFDHNIHEALMQQPSDDVAQETVIEVIEAGYFLGSTLLRAAKVVVAVPNG